MSAFPWASVLPVVGGVVANLAFATMIFEIWRFRRAGSSSPGLAVGSRPVPEGLPLEETTAAWGWIRPDGAQWVVFVDPYDTSGGAMRLSTPLPYRARIDPATNRLTLQAPLVPFLLLSLCFFPLSLIPLGINHMLIARRVEWRLAQLATREV